MENDRSEFRWCVEQRLDFIGFRLFWEGQVSQGEHARLRKAEVKVYLAPPYYTLKRLRFATEASVRTPQDQQIVLINRDHIQSGVG